ncbi:MAG: LacI family DNA-binding transcriptional regulator [Erysipelotrichaceae bacterium]|nr:LacI family DNA-binding transcriptional regulator [Erysipelotrichaceae bacterium]
MKRLTIKDIAKLADVSKTTVSFYINGNYDKMSNETKEKIKKIIDETGFRPSNIARSLNNKKSKLIGVVIGNITNSLSNQIVKGIDDCAHKHGYQLIVGNSNFNKSAEEQYLRSMSGMGVDGFIIQPTSYYDEIVSKINFKEDVVFIDSLKNDSKGMWIKTNNYEAVLDALEILMEYGYEHYIMVSEDPHILTTRMERYRGFIDILKLNNKSFETIIVENNCSEYLKDEFSKRLDTNKKTLVFAGTNLLLSEVYQSLKDYIHLIPEKLGLIGFDSLEWTNLVTPSVTTIVQPSYEEGYRACEMLIDKMEGINKELPNQIFKCEINFKDSTK